MLSLTKLLKVLVHSLTVFLTRLFSLTHSSQGAVLFALNQGEVCTCPSRILVDESIYDKFMKRVVERTKAIKRGHPLDPSTMIGAQASLQQMEKIESYLKIGKDEGAQVLTGGTRAKTVEGGYYIEPTIFKGSNNMRVFQEEIFGPVIGVTTFKVRNMSYIPVSLTHTITQEYR